MLFLGKSCTQAEMTKLYVLNSMTELKYVKPKHSLTKYRSSDFGSSEYKDFTIIVCKDEFRRYCLQRFSFARTVSVFNCRTSSSHTQQGLGVRLSINISQCSAPPHRFRSYQVSLSSWILVKNFPRSLFYPILFTCSSHFSSY